MKSTYQTKKKFYLIARFKIIYFIIFQIALCFFLLELSAAVFFTTTNNSLHRVKNILQVDSSLGWKLQKNLNSNFENKKLFTDSNGFRISEGEIETKESLSILTLGPSSAFGWGVNNNDTYSFIAANRIGLNIFNASQIGYTSHQGLILLKNEILLASNKYKYAIISYGINDLDKIRFYTDTYVSDQEYFSKDILNYSSLKKNLAISNLANFIYLFSDELNIRFNCFNLSKIEQRVSANDFIKNIQEIIDILKNNKIQPIIVNTPYYLKYKNINYSRKLVDDKYSKVTKFAIESNCSLAIKWLNEAKSLEADRINQDVIQINGMLKKVAYSNRILYIDAFDALNTSSIENNYLDPVHPSAAGHQIIAGLIISNIIK